MGRELEVLCLDDRGTQNIGDKKGHGRHFQVKVLRRWRQLQAALARSSSIPAPDIILVDVSFDRDDDVLALQQTTESGNEVVLLGPLLALPFLFGRDVMAFMPYSQFVKDPEVLCSPLFLLPMGLIAARMERKVFESGALDKTGETKSLDHYVNQFRDKKRAVTDPARALEKALPLYRASLETALQSGQMKLTDSAALSIVLAELNAGLKKDDKVEVPADACVKLVGRQHGNDSLLLRSLFADQLNWTSETITRKGLDQIQKVVDPWGECDPIFNMAIRLCKIQDEEENITGERTKIDKLIQREYPHETSQTWHELMRLLILFANVHAWESRVEHSRRTAAGFLQDVVHHRLGFGSHRNYKDCFGERLTTNRGSVLGHTLKIAPLPLLTPSRPKNDCFYLTCDSTLSALDEERLEMYVMNFGKDLPYQYFDDHTRGWKKSHLQAT